MENTIERRNDVTRSILKLMRAMRRRPMHEQEFPPAVGRMLMTLREHDGAAPAELCEIMDVRPSSMSELLGRMEEHVLITRVSDEADRRATKVFLSEGGKDAVGRIETRFHEENAKLTACFTEEEIDEFCALCDKLSAHLESDVFGEERPHGHCGHHGPHGPHGGHHGHHGGPHGPHCHHGKPMPHEEG